MNSSLLKLLSSNLREEDFADLAKEGGFEEPNKFDISRMKRVWMDGEFPDSDFFEYCWAIYECSRDELRKKSLPLQVFLGAIFVYCNRRQAWGMRIEAEYYQLSLMALFRIESTDLSFAYIDFLRWLGDSVEPSSEYDNYFRLLSCSYLLAHLGKSESAEFSSSLAELEALLPSKVPESELTVAEEGLAWWRDISAELIGGELVKSALVAALPAS